MRIGLRGVRARETTYPAISEATGIQEMQATLPIILDHSITKDALLEGVLALDTRRAAD